MYFYILELGKSNGMIGIIKQVLGKPLKESPFYGWYGTFIKRVQTYKFHFTCTKSRGAVK